MDGRLTFEDSTLRDFLTLFSVNRLSLGSLPAAEGTAPRLRGLEALPAGQPDRQGAARTSPTTTTSATTSTSSSSTRACSTPAPTSSTTARPWRRRSSNKLRLIAAKLNLKPGLQGARHRQRLGRSRALPGGLEDVDVTGVTLSKEQHALSNEKARARRPRPSRALRAARLPRAHRPLRPHRLGRHVRARRRRPLRRVLRQGQRAARRRRRHAAALDRPHEPARHREPVAPEVHLPRRLLAGAVRGVPGGRAARACG